jgi:hypothetical protein
MVFPNMHQFFALGALDPHPPAEQFDALADAEQPESDGLSNPHISQGLGVFV